FFLQFNLGYSELCKWNQSTQLESIHDKRNFFFYTTASSCNEKEFELTVESNLSGHALHLLISCTECDTKIEVYEIITANGISIRIPRHRSDSIDRKEYMSARDSGFVVIFKKKGEVNGDAHVHVSYTAKLDVHHRGYNHSCPYPLISLNEDNPIFRPSYDFVTFNCAVQINSTSNVQRVWHYPEIRKDIYGIYHTRWEFPFESMVSLQTGWDKTMNSTEKFVENLIFGDSFVVLAWNDRHYEEPSDDFPGLIGIYPNCTCNDSEIRLVSPSERQYFYRPRIAPPDCDQPFYCGFACYHVTCSTSIALDPAIPSSRRLTMRSYLDDIDKFASLTDGNHSISNIRSSFIITQYTSSSSLLTLTLHAVQDPQYSNKDAVFEFATTNSSQECQCPNSSRAIVNFEFPPECEFVDCIVYLEGKHSFITYDAYQDCNKERLLFGLKGGVIREAIRGFNAIQTTDDAPLMIWFHRQGKCDYASKSVVARGDPMCNCIQSVITIFPGRIHEFISPGFGTQFSYCPNMNCTTFFHAPENHHILFTINELDVADDQLKIYLGSSTDDFLLTYTSYEEEVNEIDSGEREIIVNFVSDDAIEGTGYNITVRAIPFEEIKGRFSWWIVVVSVMGIAAAVVVLGFIERKKIRELIPSFPMSERLVFSNPFTDEDGLL
ncbi:hypothetical protein PMAYCL1PPCAC_02255, partial [Pristionchus mayeri]